MASAALSPIRFSVVLDDGTVAGPLDARGLKKLAIAGVIHRKSPLRVNSGEWLPSGRVRDLFNPTVSAEEFADAAVRPSRPSSAGLELPVPIAIVMKADNIIRDARLAILAGLIPLVGLFFVHRLVQWHRLARSYPSLNNRLTDRGRDFYAAKPRLWFAVLFWPIVLAVIAVYSSLTI